MTERGGAAAPAVAIPHQTKGSFIARVAGAASGGGGRGDGGGSDGGGDGGGDGDAASKSSGAGADPGFTSEDDAALLHIAPLVLDERAAVMRIMRADAATLPNANKQHSTMRWRALKRAEEERAAAAAAVTTPNGDAPRHMRPKSLKPTRHDPSLQSAAEAAVADEAAFSDDGGDGGANSSDEGWAVEPEEPEVDLQATFASRAEDGGDDDDAVVGGGANPMLARQQLQLPRAPPSPAPGAPARVRAKFAYAAADDSSDEVQGREAWCQEENIGVRERSLVFVRAARCPWGKLGVHERRSVSDLSAAVCPPTRPPSACGATTCLDVHDDATAPHTAPHGRRWTRALVRGRRRDCRDRARRGGQRGLVVGLSRARPPRRQVAPLPLQLH